MKPTFKLLTALLLAPLADVMPAADGIANGVAPPEILAPEELAFVRELATKTLEASGVAKFSACTKEPEKQTRFVSGMTSYQTLHP